jgi:hypothetical protein
MLRRLATPANIYSAPNQDVEGFGGFFARFRAARAAWAGVHETAGNDARDWGLRAFAEVRAVVSISLV